VSRRWIDSDTPRKTIDHLRPIKPGTGTDAPVPVREFRDLSGVPWSAQRAPVSAGHGVIRCLWYRPGGVVVPHDQVSLGTGSILGLRWGAHALTHAFEG
jgi:hypothetical protein